MEGLIVDDSGILSNKRGVCSPRITEGHARVIATSMPNVDSIIATVTIGSSTLVSHM